MDFEISQKTKELINSIYDLKPSLVVLSVTLPSNIATLQEIVKNLKMYIIKTQKSEKLLENTCLQDFNFFIKLYIQ